MATEYKYLNSDEDVVIRVADNRRFHPKDDADFLAWKDAGGIPDPADPPTSEELATLARADRDARIQAVAWRYERNAREQRLGIAPSDDIAALDAYVQALADLPKQKGFPAKIKWPTL